MMTGTKIYETQPIKDAMQEQSLSVQDVAEKSGVTRPTVYDILDGKPTVKVETLSAVADALNVSLNLLFPDSDKLAA
jgi:transcriptional regulator with XRE-family HTH domain